MSVQTLRFRTTHQQAPTVSEEITALFAAVQAAAPPGIRYTALREADEPVFTLILELADATENPLPSIPAAVAFRNWLPTQTDDDLTPRPCTMLSRYSA